MARKKAAGLERWTGLQPSLLAELRRYPLGDDTILALYTPRRIGISQTAPLMVAISAVRAGCQFQVQLQSPSFDISPPEPMAKTLRGGELYFDWLFAPKKIGEHVLVFWADRDCTGGRSAGITSPTNARPIHIPILVVNDLGLTAFQVAVLSAVAAILGIISVLYGLPFLKRALDRSHSEHSPPMKDKRARSPGRKVAKRKIEAVSSQH